MIYPKLSDGTIDWCVMCKHEGSDYNDLCCECEYSENSDDPPAKYEPKPATNADRIRSMTDEELAGFIAQQRCCTIDPIADKLGIDTTQMFVKCQEIMLDWLKQEAIDE